MRDRLNNLAGHSCQVANSPAVSAARRLSPAADGYQNSPSAALQISDKPVVDLHAIFSATEIFDLLSIEAEASRLIEVIQQFRRGDPEHHEAVKAAKCFSKEKAVPAAVKVLERIKPKFSGNDLLHLTADLEILSNPKSFHLPKPITPFQLLVPFVHLEGHVWA